MFTRKLAFVRIYFSEIPAPVFQPLNRGVPIVSLLVSSVWQLIFFSPACKQWCYCLNFLTIRIHCLSFFSMKRQKSIKRAGKNERKKEKVFWINWDRAKCFCLKRHLFVCLSMSFWYATKWEIHYFVWFPTGNENVQSVIVWKIFLSRWEIPGWKKEIHFPKEPSMRLGFSRGRKIPWGLRAPHFSLSLGCSACCRESCHPCAQDNAAHPKHVTLYPSLLINCSALDANLQFHPVRACCRLIAILQ